MFKKCSQNTCTGGCRNTTQIGNCQNTCGETLYDADKVIYSGPPLPCTGIETCDSVNTGFQKLDKIICDIRALLLNTITLINVGVGARIYKGINSLGQKQLRSLVKTGNLITINEALNNDEIEFSIDETELEDFINNLVPIQHVYNVANVGTVTSMYQGNTLLPNTTTFNIKGITETGNLIDITENTTDVNITINEANLIPFIQTNQKTYSIGKLGNGEEIYKAPDTILLDNTQFNFKSLVSDTLKISTNVNNELQIELPTTNNLKQFIVNNAYYPTYDDWKQAGGDLITNPTFEFVGIGTNAKPFTNTRIYTSETTFTDITDTAIQNALDAYLGTSLIKSAPQYLGAVVSVQSGVGIYNFYGDIEYNSLILQLEENTQIVSIPTNDWFCNIDNWGSQPNIPIGFTEGIIYLILKTNAFIQLTKNGFKNNGLNVPTNTLLSGKTLNIKMERGARILQVRDLIPLSPNFGVVGEFVIFDLNSAKLPYNNDGNGLLNIEGGTVQSYINPIIKQGSNISDIIDVTLVVGAINITDTPTTNDPTIDMFQFSGGSYIRIQRCSFYTFHKPDNLFTLKDANTNLKIVGNIINGEATTLVKISCEPLMVSGYYQDPVFSIEEVNYTDIISFDNLIEVDLPIVGRTQKYQRAYINNCVFSSANSPDPIKIDMTQGNTASCMYFTGTSNYGKQIIQYLISRLNRTEALLTLPYGSLFLNRNGDNDINNPIKTGWTIDTTI